MSKKKNKIRGNDKANNNDRNANIPNEPQNVSNASNDEKDKRRHDNIKKEEQHRWPKQM